jgi:hypothetical protein
VRFARAVLIFLLPLSVAATPIQIPKYLESFPKIAHHKLTSGKQTIGKTSLTWKVDSDLICFDETSEMKITLFNQAQAVTTFGQTWTNEKLEIQKLKFQMRSAGNVIAIDGIRHGSEIQLNITQAGQTQTKAIKVKEPMLTSATIRPFLLMKGLPQKKSQLSATMLEPSALAAVPFKMAIQKKNSDTWLVSIDYLQHKMNSEMNARGSLLKESSDFAGLPVESQPVSEDELKLLHIEGTQSDLVELAKVHFPRLVHSKDLRTLSVKISGVDLHSFELSRHRQVLHGDILTTQVEGLPNESLPVQSLVGQANMESYLKGDAFTEVYDPMIQKQAKEIVGQESDLWKRALLVKDFVYRTIEKSPTVSIPNAIEVLKTKKGDCNEHAVLYTALARAAGIPTRTVVGLVYSTTSAGSSGFFYHAWVEVYAGKEWVAIDPTWNQVPADATHLAFVEGGLDQQVQVTSLMGKIKLAPVNPL